MRVLLRRLKNENWSFRRTRWTLNNRGVGTATYQAQGPERTYTLVVFAHDLPDEKRSDRVIADAWDATFTLLDGIATNKDIARLKANVPHQEVGRISERELVLSRANKSLRLFDYVRDCLAAGKQPDIKKLDKIGYLMRTTAVYGSGKFGAADREVWSERKEFLGSFQPELLAVWLIRTFTIDLVEHLAQVKAPRTFVPINKEIRRQVGVGNSTGLGMAPFLINHPALFHSWINAREVALARVRSTNGMNSDQIRHFYNLVERALNNVRRWHTDNPYQKSKTKRLCSDLEKLLKFLKTFDIKKKKPWNELYEWAERNLLLEAQEQLVSLLIEEHPGLVDDLAESMTTNEQHYFRIDGSMSLKHLLSLMKKIYYWAEEIDFDDRSNSAHVWYISEEKLEPRLGNRFEESIEPFEQPLAPGRDAKSAINTIVSWVSKAENKRVNVAQFLLKHPEHRHIIRRSQIVSQLPYAEIHDNTISSQMLPIDLLRCKLSFFGASKFDPRSNKWLRITMFQGAPFPDELAFLDPDEFAYPQKYSEPRKNVVVQ